MVKIARTNTKYPSPTEEFLPYGNVALCFPCLSQEQRRVLQSTGTNLLPQLVCTVAVAFAQGGVRRFCLGKRKTFSTDLSGNCALATFEYSSCIFHPISSRLLLVPVPALPPADNSFPSRCHIRCFKGKLNSIAVRTCQLRHKGNARGQVLKDGKEIYRCSLLVLCPTHFCMPLTQELKIFSDICMRIWACRALCRVELPGMLPASKVWPPPV